jgi:hypothetical protein
MENVMSNIQHYVTELNKFSTNSAKSIISTAAIIYQAKQELSEDDYLTFLTQTKYDKSSSAIRKLVVIGNAQARLLNISHLLPANWTTIYKIASLEINELNLLVENNVLHPLIKPSDIEAATNKTQFYEPKMRINLELDIQTDCATAIELIDDIKALLPKYLFKIKLNDDLNGLINK